MYGEAGGHCGKSGAYLDAEEAQERAKEDAVRLAVVAGLGQGVVHLAGAERPYTHTHTRQHPREKKLPVKCSTHA
jgi:hypothetical protein